MNGTKPSDQPPESPTASTAHITGAAISDRSFFLICPSATPINREALERPPEYHRPESARNQKSQTSGGFNYRESKPLDSPYPQ
jgi:hypothetical protein